MSCAACTACIFCLFLFISWGGVRGKRVPACHFRMLVMERGILRDEVDVL